MFTPEPYLCLVFAFQCSPYLYLVITEGFDVIVFVLVRDRVVFEVYEECGGVGICCCFGYVFRSFFG